MRELVASWLAVALLVSGCASQMPGSATPQPVSSPSPAGAVATSVAYEDVDFAQLLLAHDRQTVRLCDLLLAKRDVDPAVHDLTERMRSTRQREIDQVRTWLATWGLDELPSDHDHGGQAHGLLLPGQLLRFEHADGPTAQLAFLQVMITRDRGLRASASTYAATGSDHAVRTIAAAAVATGDTEVAELEALLPPR